MTIVADQARRSFDTFDVARRLAGMRNGRRPFIIGITGSVAAGKSTFAAALFEALPEPFGEPRVDLVGTDGFLFDNEALNARGLALRKGFPESFDAVALGGALTRARRGPVVFPGYSHFTYDVDPGLARRVDRPDVLIVEGLGLGPHRALLDAFVYLDAGEADLEVWFVMRFMSLWAAAEHDPTSFYVRFRGMDETAAAEFARSVWTGINLPNLRDHIAPQRHLADLVVRKGSNHEIIEIAGGHGQAALL